MSSLLKSPFVRFTFPNIFPPNTLSLRRRCALTLVCLTILLLGTVGPTSSIPLVIAGDGANNGYKKPPKEILDVLNEQPTPTIYISPTRDYMILAEGINYPSISALAEPMLRLAGLRLNPNTNGAHRAPYFVSLTLKSITTSNEKKITLPVGVKLGVPTWSPDGRRFAFTNTTQNGIELWVADTSSAANTGAAHRIPGVRLNVLLGGPGGPLGGTPMRWMADNKSLLVRLVPAGRGIAPADSRIPIGPNIQESNGKLAPVRTYQDMLKTPHDEDLFDYYATTQLARVDTTARPHARTAVVNIGKPAILDQADPSPDGNLILVEKIHRPYSYLLPFDSFAKDVEVWDRAGKTVYKLANLPLADSVPMGGVPTGPRGYNWRATEPATLVWVEALDQGDLRNKAPKRDKVLMLKAPFNANPTELISTTNRYMGLQWLEKDGRAFIHDFDRDSRTRTTYLINADEQSRVPQIIRSLNIQDRYNNPGQPVMRVLSNGERVVMQVGDYIYQEGDGAGPDGDRPFLDRFNLKTLKSERLFRCDADAYEGFVALLDNDGAKIITRRETPSDPPNYFIRTLSAGGVDNNVKLVPLTNYKDPLPQLRGITKQLVKYKRADGADLSFTLYLPPGVKPGTRLPTVMWAYPLEYNDADTAGQVSGSTRRFTRISGFSHLFFLLHGYAVLDNVTMPIIGDPKTVNDTYVEQLVASAKAAIDKATEMGVTDPDRVGVGGHSYGAFMTANLLAHTKLFRAGIARSGAYNRTLTPFGFQSERRTLWEAPELYSKISPFNFADKITTPILLIHGEADNNQGTFPIQSERMYQAIRGNGGTVRLVTLPYEAHGYAARESIEHTLYEMINWFDKYVKNSGLTADTKKVEATQ